MRTLQSLGAGRRDGGAARLSEIPALTQGTDREYVAHADVTGDLGKYGIQTPWAKSGLQINAGTEFRSESTSFNPDEENITDDIAGGGGAVLPIAGNFHVWEGFSEFNMPILDGVPFAEQLTLNGGYRYSKYTLGFSTNTYKFGVECGAHQGRPFPRQLQPSGTRAQHW